MDMLAITQTTFGGPEVLTPARVPRPAPIPTEVLVRVHAAAVNPIDWKIRAHNVIPSMFDGGPVVLGWDVAGVVEAVGPGVTRFRVGDHVFGMPRLPKAARAYAEFVTAPARHLARIPAGLDHVHAAALPMAGLTAWQALVDTAGLQKGQRVLVHAAAGGVGHVAVQVAKALGAHVTGTASAGNHDFVRALGADQVIDYRTTDFAEVARDLDVVLDLVGGDYGLRSIPTLRPGGVLLTIAGPTGEDVRRAADAAGVWAGWMMAEPDHHGLERLAGLVEQGALRVEVDQVLPLAQAAEAHRRSETGRTRGKIVLSA